MTRNKPTIKPQADETKAETSRRQVLSAAARLMRQQGYSATTLRQIADSVGLKAGSIYYHFDSKEQIIDEILDLGITTVHSAVERAIEARGPNAPARERIEAAVTAHLRALFEHGDFASVNMRIYGLIPEEIRERNTRRREAYAALWDGLFQRAQAEGLIAKPLNRRIIRLILIGALNWTVEWFDPRKGPVDEIARTFNTMLSTGFFTSPRKPRRRSARP